MTTPILPLPEGVNISVGSELARKARSLKAEFGGGYIQRTGDGINNVRGEYAVVIENLTRDEATIFDNFFTDLGGWRAFLYTRPGEATPRKWICEAWNIRHVAGSHDTLTTTFIEVFDP